MYNWLQALYLLLSSFQSIFKILVNIILLCSVLSLESFFQIIEISCKIKILKTNNKTNELRFSRNMSCGTEDSQCLEKQFIC